MTLAFEQDQSAFVLPQHSRGSHNNRIYNNTVSDSGSGIDIDEDSFENVVYNNTIINLPDQSEALHLRDGASEQNTLHSNTLITIPGERISLDREQE